MGRIETVALTISTTVCETDSWWIGAVQHRELSPVLCDDLEEWNGVGSGKEAQEGGDICALVTQTVQSPPAMQET